MTAPALSVVVASVNGLPYLADCLEALDQNAPEAEVIVADWTDEATRQLVRERWPEVKLLSFDAPTTVPELRAAGIFAAAAPNVAVIEDHCDVLPGWAAGMLAAHARGTPSWAGRFETCAHAASVTGRRSSASTAPSWSLRTAGWPGACPA